MGSHPGNSTDAVRRWSRRLGSVQITGTTFDGDTSCGIDGVQVTIKKNKAVLLAADHRRRGYHRLQFQSVQYGGDGRSSDFVTNKLTTSAADNTVFMPTTLVPEFHEWWWRSG